MAAYFETLTFILLKRVQPMMSNEGLKAEEKEFAMTEVVQKIT